MAMKSKIPALLLSFAVALGLWLYVVTNVSPQSEQNYTKIPVIFENESVLLDRDLMLVSGQDSSVSVRLNGNRADLNNLSSGNIVVTVDLSGITEPGHYEREYKISYPSGITSVSVAKRITPTVSLDVVEYASKEVPVQIVTRGTLRGDLILDEEKATTSVQAVTVSGPKSEVDQISFAGLEVDCSDLTATLTGDYVYTLMNADGEPVNVSNVRTDTGEIHLVLPVEHVKDVPLKVELVDGGGATGSNADCGIEPKFITISGSEEALAKIDEWVLTTVNLGDVDLGTPYVSEVEIKLPENLTNRSGVSTAQVTVSLNGLVTKTITLTRDHIQTKNVPEGMEARVFTQQLDIILRGSAGELETITADDITATVDLTEKAAGNFTLPLEFTIDKARKAGVYGKYSVAVGVSPVESGGGQEQ